MFTFTARRVKGRWHTGRVPRRASTDGGAGTLRAEQVEATRRAVLDAARAAFGSKGYAQASIEEIAAAARVTKGAVYHHFAGKEALFRAVWAEVEADAQARAVADRDPELAPIDQIVAMVQGYLDAALDEEIRRITLVDGPALLGLDPELPPDQEAVQAQGRAFVAAAIAQGEIIDVDPGLLLGLIGGVALQAGLQIARAGDPEATREALGRAIDAMLRGLAPGR
jgi:AcrR family transcriptional regulator